jgi:hypothetical protein
MSATQSTIVELLVVTVPRRLDEIMHRADMFQPSQRLIYVDAQGLPTCHRYELTVDPEKFDLEKTITAFKAKAAEDAADRLLACFIPGQPGGWYDETCRMVSTGKSWCLFEPVLKKWGFV